MPQQLCLKYQGAITPQVVDPLLTMVLHRLESIEPNINIQKKVYSILMECAQNICLHVNEYSEGLEWDTTCGYLSVECNQDAYQVISGNFISNEKREALTSILEKINNLETPEELKNLYNKVISNHVFGANGGGGLGLIDVARKSTGKLNYSFDTLNSNYSFFTLNIVIKKK